jgi:hypothetical protein
VSHLSKQLFVATLNLAISSLTSLQSIVNNKTTDGGTPFNLVVRTGYDPDE